MSDEFNGLRLTPQIFANILLELFDGKQFNRQMAVDLVKRYFAERGGELNRAEYVSTFKKATQYLKGKGLENRGQGIWSLSYKEEVKIEAVPIQPRQPEVIFDSEVGQGSASVYVYYYDIYQKDAIQNNKSVWPCKIGRTDKTPMERILSQSGTAYPELPHNALLIRCEDSAKLESAIHSILKLRGRWLENAPGTEWFLTSPEEVKEICQFLFQGETNTIETKFA